MYAGGGQETIYRREGSEGGEGGVLASSCKITVVKLFTFM